MVTKAAFYREMNRHANTSYRCVNSTYIVEYGHGPLTETDHITVWRHVESGEADAEAGEEGHTHDWINVASTGFIDPAEARRLYQSLTTNKAVLELRDDPERNINLKAP